jgi:predicted permease
MRWVRRIPEGLLILLALPAYQLWYIAKYANTRKGRAAKIGVFISFLSLIVTCSVIWGFLWVMMLWLLWRDIN